ARRGGVSVHAERDRGHAVGERTAHRLYRHDLSGAGEWKRDATPGFVRYAGASCAIDTRAAGGADSFRSAAWLRRAPPRRADPRDRMHPRSAESAAHG